MAVINHVTFPSTSVPYTTLWAYVNSLSSGIGFVPMEQDVIGGPALGGERTFHLQYAHLMGGLAGTQPYRVVIGGSGFTYNTHTSPQNVTTYTLVSGHLDSIAIYDMATGLKEYDIAYINFDFDHNVVGRHVFQWHYHPSNGADEYNDQTNQIDIVTLYEGDDFMRLRGGDDTGNGAAGNDTINGGDGNDTLNGGQGNDILNGDADNDELSGDTGNDTIDGGDGIDTASYFKPLSEYVISRVDATTIRIHHTRTGYDGTDTVKNVELFHFNLEGDWNGRDVTYTLAQLLAQAPPVASNGPDVLVLFGGETVHALGGNDSVTGSGNLNVAFGDEGGDQLFFTGNQNQLFGGVGNDWLGVNGTNNALVGGDGDEVWIGASGNSNTLDGQAGNDALFVNGVGNNVYGGDGNDWLGCSGTSNTLLGGAGQDWMGVSGSSNAANGGEGHDTLLSVGTNILYGENGNDWVGCSGNNNWLFGMAGDDYLAASGNGNALDGGEGNDTLVAAAGHTGDRFIFRPGYQRDRIEGFAAGNAATDVIDLRGFGLTYTNLINTYAFDTGGNVVLRFGLDVLTIAGVTKAQLTEGDFLLS